MTTYHSGSSAGMPRNQRLTTLGQQIRAARETKGWAQSQLAERCDLSIESVSRIERGEISPRFVVVERIVEVLGIEWAALLSLQPAKPSPRRTAVARIVRILEELDDATLGNLGDFLRGVSRRRTSGGPASTRPRAGRRRA